MQTHVEPSGGIGLVDALHTQHLRLEAQLAEMLALVRGDDVDAMRALWSKLEDGLLAHLDLEEMHLLPRATRETARAVRAEHAAIRVRLGEIGIGLDLHIVRAEHIERLAKDLRAHAAFEDKTLYPQAERALEPHVRSSILRRVRDTLSDLSGP